MIVLRFEDCFPNHLETSEPHKAPMFASYGCLNNLLHWKLYISTTAECLWSLMVVDIWTAVEQWLSYENVSMYALTGCCVCGGRQALPLVLHGGHTNPVFCTWFHSYDWGEQRWIWLHDYLISFSPVIEKNIDGFQYLFWLALRITVLWLS